MVRIPVLTLGDTWCNQGQVLGAIEKNHTANCLVFDLRAEGPSLHALGIVDGISRAIHKISMSPDQVWIDNWHNSIEDIPFQRANKSMLSHFFWMSDNYRHTQGGSQDLEYQFGMFVGRLTLERAVIMYDLYHNFPGQVLMSLMSSHAPVGDLGQTSNEWIQNCEQLKRLLQWIESGLISSITHHSVQDQYSAGINTNAALIPHYARFTTEIVCETYCKGVTFFPTEKTVRPISQGKPILVYGPKNFLKNLRTLGFKTWSDYWDESYDDAEGSTRWKLMQETLEQITDLDTSQSAPWRKICQHNITVLENLICKYKPG